MSSKTLELWQSLEKTDPKHTKQFNRGGFKGTAINGTYIAKRLTEAFGPCGIGWKLVLEDERIIPGPVGADGAQEQLHVVRCHIAYRLPSAKQGEWLAEWHATGPQFGQTKIVQRTSDRVIFDEEAPKKSLTDAMSKCASLLGVASDVHLGLYDDNKYVNQMKVEFGSSSEPQPEKTALISDAQVKTLIDKMEDAGLTSRAFCKAYDIPAVPSLPASRYDEALTDIAAYKAKHVNKPTATQEKP